MCNKNSLDWRKNDKETMEIGCGGAAFIRHRYYKPEQHEAGIL
jgi:hypothetical protein